MALVVLYCCFPLASTNGRKHLILDFVRLTYFRDFCILDKCSTTKLHPKFHLLTFQS
jgi:hypothetical protein